MPRKGSAVAGKAKGKGEDVSAMGERLIEAFWALLEERRMADVCVRAVVEKAGCNRSSFYYHFDGIDDLIYGALEREISFESSFADVASMAFLGDASFSPATVARDAHFRRIALVVETGGVDIVSDMLRRIIRGKWEAALGLAEDGLSEEAKMAIEYSMFGTLGVISALLPHSCGEISEESARAAERFMGHNALFLVERIAHAQGIEPAEALARLRALECAERPRSCEKSLAKTG